MRIRGWQENFNSIRPHHINLVWHKWEWMSSPPAWMMVHLYYNKPWGFFLHIWKDECFWRKSRILFTPHPHLFLRRENQQEGVLPPSSSFTYFIEIKKKEEEIVGKILLSLAMTFKKKRENVFPLTTTTTYNFSKSKLSTLNIPHHKIYITYNILWKWL